MADPLDEYESLLGEQQNGHKEEKHEDRARSGDGGDRDKGKERSSRDKERSSSRRKSSRSRERNRSRERRRGDRENDFKSEGGSKRRSRSRSRDRRDRERRDRDRGRVDRDRERERERERGRDYRRGPPPPRKRSLTPPEVRAARERERELKELERATRTVFAFNLNIKADERDIFEFFSRAGQVTDIRLITDRHTKRSKGLAYVEFSKQEEVFVALALTGQLMLGQPVMVKPAEAEKNLAWEAQQAAKQSSAADAELAALGLPPVAGGAAAPVGPLRLQVTGFKKGLGENEIKQIFEPFGPIASCEVVRDGAGVPINIAYVVFQSAVDGRNAQQHWHGQTLLDHELNVTIAPLTGGDAGGGSNAVGELDDDDFKLNTQTRAALMSRLASSAGMSGPASGGAANALLAAGMLATAPGAMPTILPGGLIAPGVATVPGLPATIPGMLPAAAAAAAAAAASAAMPGGIDLSLQQGLLGPPSPIPTQCVLLKNMFDASTQTEPNWDEELAEDVRDECSKYGQVLHMFVDKSSQGFVYLKFNSAEAAQAASRVLHGRYYNGHMIQAAFQFVQTYNQHFGL